MTNFGVALKHNKGASKRWAVSLSSAVQVVWWIKERQGRIFLGCNQCSTLLWCCWHLFVEPGWLSDKINTAGSSLGVLSWDRVILENKTSSAQNLGESVCVVLVWRLETTGADCIEDTDQSGCYDAAGGRLASAAAARVGLQEQCKRVKSW